MYPNFAFKKYFFVVLALMLAFMGGFMYFFYPANGDFSSVWKLFTISCLSFLLNILTILNVKFKKKKRTWALIIYCLLFISSLKEFSTFHMGIAYLLLSIVLILLLDIFPVSSSIKYFNVGMLTTIASFLYFPVGIIIILFLLITVLYYEEKINISQYIAGVLVTIILSLEIAYLTDSFPYIINWVNNLTIPKFHFEYQIPIILILTFILIYGWINQYSNSSITDDVQISNRHSLLVMYLFVWIIIYAFFMGDNYELLVFISLPVSLIVSRSL